MENPARTTGLEKRVRRAKKKNGINMVYYSIIHGRKEGRKGGRARQHVMKPNINKSKRKFAILLVSPSAVIVSNASEVASPFPPSAMIILKLTLPREFGKYGSLTYPTKRAVH